MYTFLIAPFSGFKQGGKGFYRDPLLGKKNPAIRYSFKIKTVIRYETQKIFVIRD